MGMFSMRQYAGVGRRSYFSCCWIAARQSTQSCDSEFSTALQAACYRGKVANVKYLLDNAADPNILGGWYGNALQIAVAFHGEIAKPLLERCADINAKGGLYSSVFEAANGDFGTNQE